MGTIWWGYAYDDPSKAPPYVARWKPLHEFFFHKNPIINKDGIDDLAEFDEAKKKELAQRRQRIMAEKMNEKEKKF